MNSLDEQIKQISNKIDQQIPIQQINQAAQNNLGEQLNQFESKSDQSKVDLFEKNYNQKQQNLNNPKIDQQILLQQNHSITQDHLKQIENLTKDNQLLNMKIQQLTQSSKQLEEKIQIYENQFQGMNQQYQQQLYNLEQKHQLQINNLIQQLERQKQQYSQLAEEKKIKEDLYRQKNEAILNFKLHLYKFKDEIKNLFQDQLRNDIQKNQKFESIFEEKLPIQKIIRSMLKWEDVITFDKILSKQLEIILINIQQQGSKQINKCPTPGCNFCWIVDEKQKTGNSFCQNCELRVKAIKTNLNKLMIINEIQPDQSIPLPSYSNFEQNITPKVSKEAAIEHRKATKIGRPNNKGRICQCCGLQIEREEFSLGVGTDQLGFIGSGYPMYFDFIKSCLVIIAIQYISVGNFLLITHIDKLFQLSQTEESLKEKQDVLSLTAIYFTMIYIIYFRHNQIKLDSFCDLKQTSPGDYTVLLQGLPLQLARDDLEFKIKEEFENVIKVCFIYKQILKNQDNSRLFMEQLQDTYFEQDYFSGSALVSFKFKENKLQFLKKAKYNKFNFYLKQFLHLDLNNDGQVNFLGLKVLVRQAPEPTDINWKYLNEWIEQPSYKKYLEILLNFLLLILLLYITCTTKQKVNKFFTLKSLFTPMITIISYYIIPYLTKFINFRKYLSWTQTQKSLAYKMTILMSLFTIFISQFFNGEMFWLFISNSILPPLFLLMRPRQLLKNYKIQFGTLPQDQKELNQLYEYQNHNLTRNHAFINYTMIITNIYGTLMPINSIVAAIGLIFYYWTDKYILLRHSTVQNQPSSILSLEMYRLISFTPLMISCQHYINSSYDTLATIQLISTLVFYFIPQDLVIKKIWKTKKLKEFAPYDEAQFNFCYDRTNPALQDKATQNWVTQQKKAHAKQKKVLHLLDEEQKDKLKKQLKKQLTKVQKLIGQMEAQLEQKQTTKLITQQDVSSSSQNKDYSDIVV